MVIICSALVVHTDIVSKHSAVLKLLAMLDEVATGDPQVIPVKNRLSVFGS